MSSSTFVSLFVATILLASLLTSTTSGVTEDTITAICSKSQYPKLCELTLKNDPRTRKAKLQELPDISVQMMNEQADMNLKAFTELHHNSTEGEKHAYGECVKLYNAMEDKIKEAHKLLKQKQYKKVLELAMESQKLANTCELGIRINSYVIDHMCQSMMAKCKVSELVNLYMLRAHTV